MGNLQRARPSKPLLPKSDDSPHRFFVIEKKQQHGENHKTETRTWNLKDYPSRIAWSNALKSATDSIDMKKEINSGPSLLELLRK